MASILVTGAEGGIGSALVSLLAAKGDRVFATQRHSLVGESVSGQVHAISMDVGLSASVQDCFAQIDGILGGERLDAVVHCAAIAPLGAVEVLAFEVFEDAFNINALGSLRVIRHAMPRLRGHGGRLVLVSSLWGRVAGPMVGAYAASKHAVEALADTVRRETRSMDFRVIVVEPGVVRTAMLESQRAGARALADGLSGADEAQYGRLYRNYADLVEKGASNAISAASAAAHIDRILRIRSPRPRYRIGTDSKMMCALAKLLPDRAMDRMFRVMLG